ncbi:MAG: hypothetical protein KJ773_03650 [Candidatus Thermoplasmatota archaeon]|nr:hypothetical protein [Candidatus Thermoplasmatota archaeon]
MSLASEKTQMEMDILNVISGGIIEPRIAIVGCGGAAANILRRTGEQLRGVPKILINTDMAGLQNVEADRKICIGKDITFNGDSGGYLEVAEKCAELASDDIKSCLISKDVVFIIAGYGGGTGTAVAPMVARMAKGLGMVTFAICILPFSAESSRRQMAEDQVQNLRNEADSIVVLDNDSLLKFGNERTLESAFRIIDNNVVSLIKDVRESMGRNFIATLAEEIMACQSEIDLAHGNAMILRDSDIGAMAGSPITPSAYPQQSDVNLVDAGGMFERF